MVAARFRNDVVAHPLRKCRNLSMKRRAFRIDGAHHATTIIATGGNGIEQRFMQPLNDGPKAIFQHPMIRSEEHTSELQSLMRISYAVFRLKTKHTHKNID